MGVCGGASCVTTGAGLCGPSRTWAVFGGDGSGWGGGGAGFREAIKRLKPKEWKFIVYSVSPDFRNGVFCWAPKHSLFVPLVRTTCR